MDLLIVRENNYFFILGREEVLNRALNIPGFSRCVPENNNLHCSIILRFLVHSVLMYYIISFMHFFD